MSSASSCSVGEDDEFDSADEEDDEWRIDLETSLLDKCDADTVQRICKGHPLPEHLRLEVWQICLQADCTAALSDFGDVFDLPEQKTIQSDVDELVAECTATVTDDDVDEPLDTAALRCELESVITHYCKLTHNTYAHKNGWTDILKALVMLRISGEDLFTCFYAIVHKYVSIRCIPNGTVFHMVRLLLQYHEPELCSFFDTKRVLPEAYCAPMLVTLMASNVDAPVLHRLWDVIFVLRDSFLIFHLVAVIVMYSRDKILAMTTNSVKEIVTVVHNVAANIKPDDVEDFVGIALHYASLTPNSLKSIFQEHVFQAKDVGDSAGLPTYPLEQLLGALCLPIEAVEVVTTDSAISSAPVASSGSLRFLLVDCRPPQQYNVGHPVTAFHLDPDLILQNPTEFNTALEALLDTQKKAVAAHSAGEHLCFIGSGRDEEDRLMHMIVAQFLQRKTQYVSSVLGGYWALHDVTRLADHDVSQCIVCCSPMTSPTSANEQAGAGDGHGEASATSNSDASPGNAGLATATSAGVDAYGERMTSLVSKFSTAMAVAKSSGVTTKVMRYIKNDETAAAAGGAGGNGGRKMKHVSARDKVSRPYRNAANVFSIDDDHEEEGAGDVAQGGALVVANIEGTSQPERIDLDLWCTRREFVELFECLLVHKDSCVPGYLYLAKEHLYILADVSSMQRRGLFSRKAAPRMAEIVQRRPLAKVLRITAKRDCPEIITFKYGNEDNTRIVGFDRVMLDKAGEATKAVKLQVLKVIEPEYYPGVTNNT